ncbi:MAG: hypothetical protein GEV06_24150 [Luteitalea sp.]|nr:hypothetical protein [Luteitalea sp.]
MSDKDAFTDRRRSQEEEYFHKREQELIAKMRRRGADEADRQQMTQRTGIADEALLQELQAIGYTPETVVLIDILPLVQVAWADGAVSTREREVIVEKARGLSIEQGSEADRKLTEWLTDRPSDDALSVALRAISAMLQARSPDQREATRQELLASCTGIASASGGVLGFGKVSDEEQALLDRIKLALEE